MAKFADIVKGSKAPAQSFVDSFSGLIAGSFGEVKAQQLALISYVLSGLKELTDASSSTVLVPGVLDLPEKAQKLAIQGMGFQEIFSSVRALTLDAFQDLLPSQIRIAKNQFSQMFGPWLAISQIAELSNALLYGPENNSGEATPASFSNLASVAKAIRIDLILAEKNLSYTSDSGEIFSTDGMRKEIATLEKIAEKLKIPKTSAQYAKVNSCQLPTAFIKSV